MKTCPKCGNIIENDSAKFCKKCGASLQIQSTQNEEVQPLEQKVVQVVPLQTAQTAEEQKAKEVKQPSFRKHNSSSNSGMWAFIIIAIIVTIVGVAIYFSNRDVDYSSLSPETGREQMKKDILSSVQSIGADIKDDSTAIVFSLHDINYIVQIEEDHYDPMYVTIGAFFELSDDYNSDIARRAAVNAAGGMPVYCDCEDNVLVFDCEMYLKDSKSFTSVLPNMVNAIKTSVERFDDEYQKVKSSYRASSKKVSTEIVECSTIYNNPPHSTSNDNKLHVLKVYWEGGNTVVEFKTYNGGEYQWCSIEKSSYLLADGVKYPLTRAEGIAYAPNHTDYPNYQSGNNVSMTFKLYFSAIPTYTKIFDFYESSTSGWVIKNIKLED